MTTPEQRERRIAYGLVAVQLVLLVAVFALPSGDAWTVPHWLWLASKVLWWAGAAIVLLGFVSLGRSLTPLPTPVAHGELRTNGLFRLVRHPIYTGVLALAIGAAVPSGNPVIAAAAVALIAWLSIKARWEEARLAAKYPDYAEYAARTPRFIPFWPPAGLVRRS